jgi:hypothetical protein
MCRLPWLLAVLVALTTLSACKTPRSVQELSDDVIVENVRTIAFYREYDPGVEHAMTRWDERQLKELDDHLDELARLSGRDFVHVAPDQADVVAFLAPDAFERVLDTYRTDYRRFFSSDDAMERVTQEMAGEALCFGRIITNSRSGSLEQAMVVIPTQIDRFLVRSCIIEELTQVMGPVNDSDDIKPSIFNDSSGNLLLSDHDRLIIRVLYDDRLQAGMSWEQAEPFVRQIVTDLRH